MKQYLPLVAPEASSIITTISIIIVFIFGISMPVAGLMADNFGLHKIIRYSLLLTIVIIAIMMAAIKYQIFNLILICSLVLAMTIAPFNALAHGLIIKAFPVRERYRGVSIGHTTGSLLMSGTANYICLLVMKYFKIQLFPLIYVGIFSFIAFISVALLSRRNKTLS